MNKMFLMLMLLSLTVFIGYGCSSDDDDNNAPQTLSEWSGTWPAATAWLSHTDVKTAIDAAASANGVTSNFLNASYEKMIGIDFDKMEISGSAITYTAGANSLTVNYDFSGKFGEGEEAWYAFESSDAAAGNKKYLILLPPEQHSDDTPLHWHFRYGDTGFDNLLNNAVWYGTVFSGDTTDASVATQLTNEGLIGMAFWVNGGTKSLSEWEGDWTINLKYLWDSGGNWEVSNIYYEYLNGFTYGAGNTYPQCDNVKDFEDKLKPMYDTKPTASIASLSISEGVVRIYDLNATGQPSINIYYKYDGKYDGLYNDIWYAFVAEDRDDAYKHLLIREFEKDSYNTPEHFHFRYGSVDFNTMFTDPNYTTWYPTGVRTNSSVEEIKGWLDDRLDALCE
ncbi:MAG: ZinT/AdcA family metal-binding protein [Deferribacteraceae bacterium]|jgi:Zn/Cd-binding protein ZinT|nr:ZinT/AdcA family metal-binding protein [Deferribacteraceae bacterium]